MPISRHRLSFWPRLPTFLGLMLFFWLAKGSPLHASLSLESCLTASADDNIFSYVIPYTDNYSLAELKLNWKEKYARATHLAANYYFRGAAYNRWSSKNYLNNGLGVSWEQDLTSGLVAGLSGQGTYYNYPDATSAKYNFVNLVALANLRFYLFFWEFTSCELGGKYQLYNLPNYSFTQEGWTPSIVFLEEVAEYKGLGGYLDVKQGLPWTMELAINGCLVLNDCFDRPLYASAHPGDFTSEKRRDRELSLTPSWSWKFLKNSNVRLGYCYSTTASNANALVNDPVNGVVMEDGYYDRKNACLILSGWFSFGRESSYLRWNTSYTGRAYLNRKAQDAWGRILNEPRADREYNFLLEFNQRLGAWLGTQWILKLGYNYLQNHSNDYYYNYNREVYSLGFSSSWYWN